MKTLYAIGEMLVDFTPETTDENGEVVCFKKNAGGAPANVAVCAAKLGGKSALITKLGQDLFGNYLKEVLRREKVDVRYVYTTDTANTALAFVEWDSQGDRRFSFYRNPSADLFLTADEVAATEIAKGDVLHFGSVDLVDYPVREAHKKAIALAKERGATVSFDPNLRYPLWKSAAELVDTVRTFLPFADVVKVSEDELFDITRLSPSVKTEDAVKSLFCGDVKIVLLTRGKEGATAYTRDGYSVFAAAEKVKQSDTTGAGDTFTGAFLYQLLRDGVEATDLTGRELRAKLGEYIRYANRAAAFTVTKKGAIPAMPSGEDVFGDGAIY